MDKPLQLLLPHLHNPAEPTLFYADEQAAPICESLLAVDHLTVVSNRYDIFQNLSKRGVQVVFSDFDSQQYGLAQVPQKVVYRISKEKAVVQHIFQQAQSLLAGGKKLIISGQKNEGIKTYADKLKKQQAASGNLKKHGNEYLGEFTFSEAIDEDHSYHQLEKINDRFYSKLGVFGWNKVDSGTELLLQELQIQWQTWQDKPQTVLDLGCGYGWIGLNLDAYGFKKIIATDNCAGALICAEKNRELINTPLEVIAGDCADNINEKVDLILCNPPFHRGFQHQQALTDLFIRRCKEKLNKGGCALFVVNSFIDLQTPAKKHFKNISTVSENKSFKVLQLAD